jgi:hypothetical protein
MPFAARADVVLPGTEIAVRPDNPIDVARWDRGRIYPAHVARDVFARDGDLVIPRGSPVELIVRQVGPGQMSLDIESVTVNGRRYAMDTTGPQFNMPRNSYDNGGGLVGSIIGAIAGANGEQVEPRGSEIRVPAGSLLRFQLQEPLRVVNWGDPGYSNGDYHYHHEHDWYR